MRVQDVLFVPGLIYSMIYVSMVEKKGFEVFFLDGKVRLRPRGSSSVGIVLRVREHDLYRLTKILQIMGRRSMRTRCRFQGRNYRCKLHRSRYKFQRRRSRF